MGPLQRALLRERFSRPWLVACAAFVVLASACRSDSADARGGSAAPPETTLPATTVMEPEPDSLGLELVLPPRVRAGEPVTFVLRVQNRTSRALDLYLRGRTITFDVVVSRAGGEVVWQRLEDQIIPAILHLRTIAPSERIELEAVWDQRTRRGTPLEPGEYAARGLLLVEGEPLETPTVPFRIVER
jgi:hypothetical protein